MAAPAGATHCTEKFGGGVLYILSIESHKKYGDHHFVWLGQDFGGWSFRMPFKHPNLHMFTRIQQNKAGK
jgi:hypothetical protein